MLQHYGLFFWHQFITLFYKIIANPVYLAGFCALILISVYISVAGFRDFDDKRTKGNNIFANILWLSVGCGIILSAVYLIAYLLAVLFRVNKLSPKLKANLKYALYPFKYHILPTRHYESSPSITVWTVLGGWWVAVIELFLAAAYCLSLLGIPIGLKHLRLVLPSLWPHKFKILSGYELNEAQDQRHQQQLQHRHHHEHHHHHHHSHFE